MMNQQYQNYVFTRFLKFLKRCFDVLLLSYLSESCIKWQWIQKHVMKVGYGEGILHA